MCYYRYEELIEDLKDEVELIRKNRINCEKELSKYKDVFNTDDKFEVKAHEYWRSKIIELDNQVSFIKRILEKQKEIFKEEILQMEQAEKFQSELRYASNFGI